MTPLYDNLQNKTPTKLEFEYNVFIYKIYSRLFTNNTFYMIHIHYNIDELISSFRWPEHEVSTKSALDLHRSYIPTADSR